MKCLICIIFALWNIVTALPVYSQQSEAAAVAVLQKMNDKLSSYETISYDYYRSINYFSENYRSETSGNTFLDLGSSDTLLGFKYQIENANFKLIYNGTESFSIGKKDSTIKIKLKPALTDFAYLSFFVNSIVTLKRSLPSIIPDAGISKELADTMMNNKMFYVVSLTMRNKTLGGLGNFVPTTITRSFLYRIFIDKENYLPQQIVQTNDAEPRDYMLTAFTNFRTNDARPSELSWYYSSYTDKYKITTDKRLQLIKEKMVAPRWAAAVVNSNERIALDKLKGKVVMLEFWIKNCGYCIAAVPKLNAIATRNRSRGLQVLGINTHDDAVAIDDFYKRNKLNFKTVYDSSGSITTAYGVDSFPTVVLIDKKGVVQYAGNVDEQKIEKVLKVILR